MVEKGRVVTGLADLPEKALIDETALAAALNVDKRTVRRMVARFELPPGIMFGGRKCWQAGTVLRWFEARADQAARQAKRESLKMKVLAKAA